MELGSAVAARDSSCGMVAHVSRELGPDLTLSTLRIPQPSCCKIPRFGSVVGVRVRVEIRVRVRFRGKVRVTVRARDGLGVMVRARVQSDGCEGVWLEGMVWVRHDLRPSRN